MPPSIVRTLFALSAAVAVLPSPAESQTAGSTQVSSPGWPVVLSRRAVESTRNIVRVGGMRAATSVGAASDNKAAAPADGAWTQAQIDQERARCVGILKRYDVVATHEQPIREGDCGAPAPVSVTRIGGVELSRPAIINCDMVANLGEWLRHDAQPEARRLLGGPLVRMDVISSYSCRNAYGRKHTRLSEHALANAIDIKSFDTANSVTADLLSHWGQTRRDIQAHIAAAKAKAKALAAAQAAEAAKARALATAQPKPPANAAQATTTQPKGNATALATASSADVPIPVRRQDFDGGALGRLIVRSLSASAGGAEPGRTSSGYSYQPPSRLGGPKEADSGRAAQPPQGGSAARKTFLRRLHASACVRFGTVLGPEANNAHRNHFHFDMAERRNGNYCR